MAPGSVSGVGDNDWSQERGGRRAQQGLPDRSAQLLAVPVRAQTGGSHCTVGDRESRVVPWGEGRPTGAEAGWASLVGRPLGGAWAGLLRAGRWSRPAPRRRERSQSLASGWAVLQLPPAGFVQLCPAAPFPGGPGRAQPPPVMPPAGPRGAAPLAAVVLLVLGTPLGKGWGATRDGWGGAGSGRG